MGSTKITLIWNVSDTFSEKYNMTYGKKYNTWVNLHKQEVNNLKSYYLVQAVNDSGIVKSYLRSSFITIDEFRDRKLKEILNG
jgi:hypothetical protein